MRNWGKSTNKDEDYNGLKKVMKILSFFMQLQMDIRIIISSLNNQTMLIPLLTSRRLVRFLRKGLGCFCEENGISNSRMIFLKILEYKAPVDLASLYRHFTLEEVKGVAFELGGDKAQGPYGFLM